ncbi:MAG: hypothetical protein AMXMBFR34_15340 [Myxococcaceae bacterium]
MANQLLTFMEADDEKAFLRFLERFHFEVYPRRVPPGWKPFKATAEALADFPQEDVYLVASDLGPALVDKIKRGPDKGSWRVDEVRSPVIFWERCLPNDDGELLSGELWAELDVTAQTGRKSAAPDQFRARYLELEAWLRKQFRKSNPKGYLIGPATARRVKEGRLKLRENKHWGREVAVH